MKTNQTMSEFERGVRAGVEALVPYFQDENEFSIYEGLSDADLAQHAAGAIQQALCDERQTREAKCTCPSGDGSLRWPCPAHPPTSSEGSDS